MPISKDVFRKPITSKKKFFFIYNINNWGSTCQESLVILSVFFLNIMSIVYTYPGCVLASIVDDVLTKQVDLKITTFGDNGVNHFYHLALKLELLPEWLNDSCAGRRA